MVERNTVNILINVRFILRAYKKAKNYPVPIFFKGDHTLRIRVKLYIEYKGKFKHIFYV